MQSWTFGAGLTMRITKAIGEVKKAILKGSVRAEPIRHAAGAHG